MKQPPWSWGRALKARCRPLQITIRKALKGQLSFAELAYGKTYFSQFGEDVILENYFCNRPSGFYVDVGAFHPFKISNTFAFYRKGWRGINIEPNPESFRGFPKHRPRDINLNVAIGLENAEVMFNCLAEKSGIDGESHLFRNRQGIIQCKIRSMPLAAVLEQHLPKSTTIDFMSVDCEGHDVQVLHSNDWERFRPAIILVEDHKRVESSPDSVLSRVGYRFERRMGLTNIYVDSSAASAASL